MIITLNRKTLQLQAIYDDRLLPVMTQLQKRLGLPPESLQVTRASHVEPAIGNDAGGNWSVDLTPVQGPANVLKDDQGRPFVTREDALAYERCWIETHCLGYGQGPALEARENRSNQHVGTVEETERSDRH
jgi:hypothetical protein